VCINTSVACYTDDVHSVAAGSGSDISIAALAIVVGFALAIICVVALVAIMNDPARAQERHLRRWHSGERSGIELEEATKKIRRDAIVIAVVSFVAGGLLTLGIKLFVHPIH